MSDTAGPSGLEPGLRQALERLAGTGPLLVAMDFDGVCAPLVDDPSRSRMLPGTRQVLCRLAEAGCLVALVSGRALASLREVADPAADWLLVGGHGAEVDTGGPSTSVLDEEQADLLRQVTDEVEQLVAAHPGSAAEHKPTAVVLHTRRADEATSAAVTEAVLAGPAARAGVHVKRGHDVVELAVVEADKGTALQALRQRTGAAAVLYAGDDVTDEDAFAVLRPEADDVGVKVGQVGEAGTAAQHRVGSPEDVVLLLEALATAREERQTT